MKQLVVVSGKGGTGKTVLSASFAALAGGTAVLADLDVDAANLHLLLRPDVRERHEFFGGKKARVDEERCTACGDCLTVCRFDAVSAAAEGKARIDQLACEGCGLCARVCGPAAIAMEPCLSGEWFVSETRFGPFVHARLGVAQENSGKLVTEVRKKAREIGERDGRGLLIMDGSPGIGCPVIASLAGTDRALIVTEPTLSGLHDLERVAGLAGHFGVRAACAVNKHDINAAQSDRIEAWCSARGIRLAGRIPFDVAVPESIARGLPLVEHAPGPAAAAVRELWESLREELG
jgi:MinD superfamily P-loop ATPase